MIRKPRRILVLALLAGLSGAAWTDAALAQQTENIAFVGASLADTYDSNVNRLAAPAAIGSWIEHAGLLAGYDRVFDRQHLYGEADIGRDTYTKASFYDGSNENVRVGLGSSFPLDVQTDVNLVHTLALANQADFAQIVRDEITTNRVNGWMHVGLSGGWHLVVLGGGGHTRHSDGNNLAMNADASQLGGGLRYQTGKDDYIDLLVRDETTKYPMASPGNSNFANSQAQYAEVKTRWQFSGASELLGGAGYVRETYDSYSFRNFFGPTFDLTYNWTPGPRLKLALFARRAVGVPGDNAYLTAVTRTLRAAPSYRLTEKVRLEAFYEQAHIGYNSDTQLLQQGLSPALARDDVVSTTDLASSWEPRRWLTLRAEVKFENRSSSLSVWDYHDRLVALRAEGRF